MVAFGQVNLARPFQSFCTYCCSQASSETLQMIPHHIWAKWCLWEELLFLRKKKMFPKPPDSLHPTTRAGSCALPSAKPYSRNWILQTAEAHPGSQGTVDFPCSWVWKSWMPRKGRTSKQWQREPSRGQGFSEALHRRRLAYY